MDLPFASASKSRLGYTYSLCGVLTRANAFCGSGFLSKDIEAAGIGLLKATLVFNVWLGTGISLIVSSFLISSFGSISSANNWLIGVGVIGASFFTTGFDSFLSVKSLIDTFCGRLGELLITW